jgi:hypothetical protein
VAYSSASRLVVIGRKRALPLSRDCDIACRVDFARLPDVVSFRRLGLETAQSCRSDDESLIVHHFAGWTREGPVITTTVPERAEVIPLLRHAAS